MQRCPCSSICFCNSVIFYYQVIILKMINIRNKTYFNLGMKWITALCILGFTCYPVIIKPMLDPSEYKEIQKISRKGIIQEEIQPGNMKVWSDPFKRERGK